MKKENIIFLLFPFIFAFYFFFLKGHIAYWEESGLFLLTNDFLADFVMKPGGWSEYAGSFLLQFYRWQGVGAFLLTLVPLGIFVFTRGIMKSLSVPQNWLILSCLPFILVCGLQCQQSCVLGETLKIFFFFFFVWAYLSIRVQAVRYVAFSLGLPLLYFFLSSGGFVLIYLFTLIYELLRGKGHLRFGVLAWWLLLVLVYPYLWQRWFYIMPDSSLHMLVDFPEENKFYPVIWFIYSYVYILLLVSCFAAKIKASPKRIFYILQVLLIMVGIGFCFNYSYGSRMEQFLRMEQMAVRGDWNGVLDMAPKIKKPIREEMFLINLALANTGRLGDDLFVYPQSGIGCLYLPRQLDYSTSVLGAEFFHSLKIPNEAIHWVFEASANTPWGINFRTLRRLIVFNIQKGDKKVADKYLTILECSVFNKKWCRERRAELDAQQVAPVAPREENDFFIGSRPFLSDMARVLDAGRNSKMTIDYILCGLLLDKDLNTFCRIFTGFYPYKPGGPIPGIYAEALQVAIDLGKREVIEKNYIFTPAQRKVFEEYNALYSNCSKDKKNAPVIMRKFKNTWWYYCHFVEPDLMDQKGYIWENSRIHSS